MVLAKDGLFIAETSELKASRLPFVVKVTTWIFPLLPKGQISYDMSHKAQGDFKN